MVIAAAKAPGEEVSGLALAGLRLTFEGFAVAEFGEHAWRKVKKYAASMPADAAPSAADLEASMLDKPLVFLKMTAVMAAATGITTFDIGRGFGRHFFKSLVARGYGKLISSMGHTYVDWLYNFNNLYLHLATLGVLQFSSPEFKVLKVTSTSAIMRYRTRRAGLSAWIHGILEFVALEFYSLEVGITVLNAQTGSNGNYEESWDIKYSQDMAYLKAQETWDQLTAQKTYAPEPALFSKLFPFHMIFDESMRLVQMGLGLRRFLPDLALGSLGTDHFEILSPFSTWDFDNLGSFKSSCFVVRLVKCGLVLKGAFNHTHMPDGKKALLYTGSPRLSNLTDLKGHNIFMSDIPPHDMSSDFVVMAEQREIEAELLQQAQTDNDHLQKTAQMLEKGKDEAEQAVTKLKQSLLEALSARDTGFKQFDADTPADKTLKLLTSILHGGTVSMTDVMELRDAIVSSNGDMRTPMNLAKNMSVINKDREVNESLMTLLSNMPATVGSNSSSSSGVEERLDDGAPACTTPSRRETISAERVPARQSASETNVAWSPSPVRTKPSLSSPSSTSSSPYQQAVTPRAPQTRRRIARHRTSILVAAQLPEAVLVLLKDPEDQVLSVLSGVNEWQFDPFRLEAVTGGRPLSTLAFYLAKKCGLMPGKYGVAESKFARFLCAIEEGYPDNAYHCRIHAADVLRSLYIILTKGDVVRTLCSEDGYEHTMLAAIFAAVIHDYEHKGLNNDFLVKSGDPLALLYNDTSPMENHHLAASFRLLLHDDYNFLKGMSAKARMELRKTVIAMVLATDMKQHFTISSMFNTKLTAIADRGGSLWARHRHSGSGGPSPRLSNSGSNAGKAGVDEETKTLALQMSLKCADLGHLCAARPVHIQWVQRLEEEFFCQGDAECMAGLPISALMDRTKQGVSKQQAGFFSIVAIPQFQSFCRVFPNAAPLGVAVTEHYKAWLASEQATAMQGNATSAAPGDAKPTPPGQAKSPMQGAGKPTCNGSRLRNGHGHGHGAMEQHAREVAA